MRIEIKSRAPAFENRSFEAVGRYEMIVGKAFGALDPDHPLNAGIVNIAKAQRDADGRVAYDCDFCLLKPVDPARGNRRLLQDIPNRGNKVALHGFNDAPREGAPPGAMTVNEPIRADDAGHGFLMRQGYALLWTGWQGQGVPPAPGAMAARLPVASDDGAPIVALSRDEYVFEHLQDPVTAPLSYPAARLDRADCRLTVRQRERDPRTTVESWRFLSETAIEIQRPAGFDAGAIYEFVYPARDPIVMGIGFAAVRDLASFFRFAEDEANPLAGAIDHALAYGMSQSGRFLRDFVHLGFNQDLAGRPVFDGMLASMAGSRRTFVDYPFAQPGRFSRQHEDRLFPHDQFPFSYAVTTDPVSGRTDGILARCEATDTCPKIIQTEGSSDFFHGHASLLVTDGGGAELAVPETVRLYHMAGVQHGGGGANALLGRAFPVARHPLNPADFTGIHRALLVALDRWVSDGTPPPPSAFPSVSDGTLVAADAADYGFPDIPGVTYPGIVNELAELDFGTQPPQPIAGRDYRVLVPAIDADGNEIAGVRVPEVAVPRGTHTGWAPRADGYAPGELVALGAYFPFAATRAERLAADDPRPSIEERYPTPADYVDAIARAAADLVARRLLLEEDVERIVAAARERA